MDVACSWKWSESTQKTTIWVTPTKKARKPVITPSIWSIHGDSWVMDITAADYFLDFCVQKSSYQYGSYTQWLQFYGLFFNSYKHAPMNCTYNSWSLLNAIWPSRTVNGRCKKQHVHSELSSKVRGGWGSDFQKHAFSKGKGKLNKENFMTLNLGIKFIR